MASPRHVAMRALFAPSGIARAIFGTRRKDMSGGRTIAQRRLSSFRAPHREKYERRIRTACSRFPLAGAALAQMFVHQLASVLPLVLDDLVTA